MELVGGGGPPVGADAVALVVDNRGMLCAQGILRLMRAMVQVPAGGIVKVLSTDPAAEHDYPAWCRTTGHPFLGEAREQDERSRPVIVSFIRKRDAGSDP